jgi:hypothetical protein
MLIPAAIILGNGVLLSYSALTGNWDHWKFLWPLEPLLAIGTVWLTIWLAGRGDFSRRLSRLLAWALGLKAVVWSIIVAVVAIVLPQ